MVYLRLMTRINSVTTSSMTGAGMVSGCLGSFMILSFFLVFSYFFLEMKRVLYSLPLVPLQELRLLIFST